MKLLILWHLHQPMYKDYSSGRYRLPWTYLHTAKNYYEMARLVGRCERIRVTFNLVPSLLEGIEDYARGQAQDVFLELFLKPPEVMGREEKEFLIENLFHLNLQHIQSNARYKELYVRKVERQELSDSDLRDLQVLFHLGWMGEGLKREDSDLKRLNEKGRNYSEQDKRLLFDKMMWVFQSTIALYRSLWEEGTIEISTTPYYHPILPLLCDATTAKESAPAVQLGAVNFRHPEDAREQVRMALAKFEAVFGRKPAGIWPAEGAVSDDALEILSEFGIRWAASDSAVLERSLPPDAQRRDAHFRPYLFQRGGKTITLFFRDHILSDLIGFVYQRWREEEAVEDFIRRLRAIERRSPGALVAVILDGENPWEHYRANGYDFLSLFYRRLEQESWIHTLTFSECVESSGSMGRLSHVHPGSWIDANFNTWIGDDEKNTAWTYLERARKLVNWEGEKLRALSGLEASQPGRLPNLALVKSSILAAEGSDWFWWFGEPHQSVHDPIFDLIFRTHLKNVYAGLGLEAPSYLDVPVGIHMGALVRKPVAFMRPVIDGRDTNYFEWLPAGMINLQARGAMPMTSGLLSKLYFGFDRENLYLRVDFRERASKVLAESQLRIELYSAAGELAVELDAGKRSEDAAVREIAEVMIPLRELKVSFGETFDVIVVLKKDQEIERYPQSGAVRLTVPDRDFEAENWFV